MELKILKIKYGTLLENPKIKQKIILKKNKIKYKI